MEFGFIVLCRSIKYTYIYKREKNFHKDGFLLLLTYTYSMLYFSLSKFNAVKHTHTYRELIDYPLPPTER